VYDTTVLRPFGARDSSAITQRDPRPEEPGIGEPGTEAADRADDLPAAISFWADDPTASASGVVPGAGLP
jgi:hypothetical protein